MTPEMTIEQSQVPVAPVQGQTLRLDEEKVEGINPQIKATTTQDGGQQQDGEHLHRGLRSRHASMLAFGGAIGTGLIIGSGVGLARSGPVGLLVAFIYVGTLCYSTLVALGEMGAYVQNQGGFPGYATRFVSRSFGGMVGVAYYCKYLLGTATQFSACSVIINYWIPPSKVNDGVWVAVFIIVTGTVQLCPVKYFGEFEFWASTFKIVVLTGLMLTMLVIDLGGGPDHDRRGFRTWKDLPFAAYLFEGGKGRFCGFLNALVTAVYSYTGTEMVGMAFGEMQDQQKNVRRAVRACFYRIVFVYCGSIFFVGLVVPADSPQLLAANHASGNANASPFVVAIVLSGIKVLPHIINAAALIFVLSAANSDVYVNSRTLFMLALDGNAPKVFLTTNRNGTPYYAVAVSMIFTCLAFTTVNQSAYTIFKYFISTVTLFSTIAWMSILWTHIRFMAVCKYNGVARESLPFYSRLNPFLSWWGLIGTAVISLSKGYDSMVHKFDTTNFVTNYLGFPIALVAYCGYSIYRGEWYVRIKDIELPHH